MLTSNHGMPRHLKAHEEVMKHYRHNPEGAFDIALSTRTPTLGYDAVPDDRYARPSGDRSRSARDQQSNGSVWETRPDTSSTSE
jgi:hypothetical protein